MRKAFLLLVCFLILFSYTDVSANIMCNDGTRSPSCTDCHRGCCSHHGGCASGGNSYSSGSNNYSYTRSYVYGCTNRNAINYNSSANRDDGSCITKVLGCMDQKADNYSDKANTSDDTCLYSTTKTVIKKIKYKTKYKFNLFKNGKIYKKGKNGRKKVTYKITKNEKGKTVSKEKISEKIITKKVDKVVYTNKLG